MVRKNAATQVRGLPPFENRKGGQPRFEIVQKVVGPPGTQESDDKIYLSLSGAIAQLGERIVRNDEVVGSIPTSSTNFFDISPAVSQSRSESTAVV